MRLSVRVLLAVVVLAALTFAHATLASDSARFHYLLALASFLMSVSLALPFICEPPAKPFWLGYSLTTGYAMLVRGFETDPFRGLFYLPMQQFFGDASLQREGTLGYFVSSCINLWYPSLLGVASGAILFVATRTFSTTPKSG